MLGLCEGLKRVGVNAFVTRTEGKGESESLPDFRAPERFALSHYDCNSAKI